MNQRLGSRAAYQGKLYQSLLDGSDRHAARATRSAGRSCTLTKCPGRCRGRACSSICSTRGMNTRMETVDAYMQIIPPGSRSGKHRHLAEECLYVVEGHGYDLHQDCDVEITDTYHVEAAGRDQALRVGSRRRDLHSALHHPPALQRRPGAPGAADLLHQPHLQEFRPQRSRADRGRARNTIPRSC